MSNENMAKAHIALTPQQVKELNAIERETDRPRTRIIRRAIEDYLTKYRNSNPDFAARFPRTPGLIDTEREFKPGITTDIVVVRGKRTEMVVTPEGGWRMPTEDDYVKEGEVGQLSIIDQEK